MPRMLFAMRPCFHMGLVFLFITACAVTPPTKYDLVQDRAVSKLYTSVTTFFLVYPLDKVGSCEYEQFADFYQTTLMSSYALRVRARAIPRNQASAAQYDLLVSSLVRLQGMHQVACLRGFQVQDLQASFDELFGSILRLELEKRYGE